MPFRARKTFFVGRRKVGQDDLVADDDPILEGRVHLFEPVSAFGEPLDVTGDAARQQPPADVEAIRERARGLGIKRVGNKSPERLAEEIAAAEAEATDQTDDEGSEPDSTSDEETPS